MLGVVFGETHVETMRCVRDLVMMRENAGLEEEEGGTGVEAGTNLVTGGGKWAGLLFHRQTRSLTMRHRTNLHPLLQSATSKLPQVSSRYHKVRLPMVM